MGLDALRRFPARIGATVMLVVTNITIEPVVMLYLTAYGLNEVRMNMQP